MNQAFTLPSLRHHKQLICYLNECQKATRSTKSSRILDLLIAMAHHLNMKTRTCHPSQGRLAAMAGISERTLRNYLRELERDGVIASQQRFNASSVYSLCFEKLAGLICRLTRNTDRIPDPSNNTPVPRVAEIVEEAKAYQDGFKVGCLAMRETLFAALKGKKALTQRPAGEGSQGAARKALAERQAAEAEQAKIETKQTHIVRNGRSYLASDVVESPPPKADLVARQQRQGFLSNLKQKLFNRGN
ncbi:helix-turn-helix domain-containing protein [Photobacterium halotolerans]|uniref:helix-turn-helix domain-containing protein n=1 Tax=Photobacterium halotolerans TaxID=265726 RepID=UPI0012DCA53B|nr:helix-turn-helix domain-containing protein [Photobacterium halotolerans]